MFEIAEKTYTHNINSVYTDTYSNHFNTFLEWQKTAGNMTLTESVFEYFKALNESDYRASTVRVKRAAVKNRLKKQSDSLNIEDQYKFEKLLSRIDKEQPAPKINSHAVTENKILSEAEYIQVLNKCRSKKQKLFIQFLYNTGARISELTTIKLTDCIIESGISRIRITGKGRKEREIKLPEALFLDITDTFKGQIYLFETAGLKPYDRSYISNQIKKICKAALNRNLSAHSLRHSFATRLISKTNKISAVSKYLGHSSVSTTMQFYCHESLTDNELFPG